MGLPRNSHVRRSRTNSLIAKWLSRIALDATRLIREKDSRRQFFENITTYANRAGADWHKLFAQRNYRRISCGVSATTLEGDMLHNVNLLAQLLKLTAVESEMLALAVALRCDGEFATIIGDLDVRSNFEILNVLRKMLQRSLEDVRKTCSRDSTLLRSHLIDFHAEYFQFVDRFKLADGLAETLGGVRTTLSNILESMFSESPQATLTKLDFAYMAADVELMIAYLSGAVRARRRGCNVLLVGLPGCGKTELARLVVAEMQCVAIEVKSVDENREPATSKERLASFSLAQACLSSSDKHIVIFDEMEDLFGDDFGHRDGHPFGKRWMNDCLESNPTPTIWIANTVDLVDPAHLRRFDIAIRFNSLPKHARASVIAKHLGNIQLDSTQLAALVLREQLLPSQVSMAAKVANTIGKRAEAGSVVMRVIDHAMALLDQKVERRRDEGFDLSLVNADKCLASLVEGLQKKGEARICMTGPPGTGKTAFAHYLAQQLDGGILSAKVSDLFSPYHGATEQRIAQVFRDATAQGKVLLFDEADSLLSKRADGGQLWQVTLVNEMLMQLDEFDGVACFTTNRMDALDGAVLRRFDFKIEFDYPTLAQRLLLFERTCPNVMLEDEDRARLECLKQLTQGDFASIKRKHRVIGNTWTLHDWLTELELEHALKTSSRPQMGFASRQ